MLESIFRGVFITSLCANGGMFLRLLRSEKTVTELKKLIDELQAVISQRRKEYDALKAENAKLSSEPRGGVQIVRAGSFRRSGDWLL